MLGACQCSFCRKHNARAFSDPKAHVTLTVADPLHLQRYSFGLKTSDQIICRRCGVYVAMTLTDGGQVWSVVNIDTRRAFGKPSKDAVGRQCQMVSSWLESSAP